VTRRPPRIMSDDERALTGRARVITPALGIPIENADMDTSEMTPPPQSPPTLRRLAPEAADDLDEWLATTWLHIANVARRTNSRVLELHQGIVDQGQMAKRLDAVEKQASEAQQVTSVLKRVLGWLAGAFGGGVIGAVLYIYAAGDKAGVAREKAAALLRDVERNATALEKLRTQVEQHTTYHMRNRDAQSGASEPLSSKENR
jgi:hypothetical protein